MKLRSSAVQASHQRLVVILTFLVTLGCLTSISPAYSFHFPWDQGHDTTDPNDPEDPGPCEGPDCENDPCNNSSTGSPVYLATGHFVWSETDIELKGRPSLSVQRTFNSQDPRIGLLGAGWSVSCDQGLVFTVRYEEPGAEPVREFIRRLPNGKRYVYAEQADGTFRAPGLFDVVTREADNTGRLQKRDGSYNIYAETGELLSEVDRNGNAINYSYDSAGRLLQKADTNGRSLNYEYNSNGLVSAIRDHTGRAWLYDYDANANLISVTDPLGGVRGYTYSQYQPPFDGQVYSHLTRVTDESGVVETEVTYNGSRVSSYRDLENTFTYQYDLNNRTATKTDSVGSQWVYTYDEDGQYTRIQAPLSRTTIFDRDDNGLQTRMVDPSGTEYTYTYDQYSNLLTESDNRGTVSRSYEGQDPWPQSISSRTGRVTTFTYDDNGNPVTIVDPDGQSTTMGWSEQGDLLQVTNALGNQSTITYSAEGLPLTTTDALGRTTQYQYDDLNNLIQVTNPAGEVMLYQYDALDRLISHTDGNGDTTTYTYDAAGRTTQITVPNGESTQYVYDAYGRLSQRIFYDGEIHSYQYRNDNLIASMMRPDSVVIAYDYDAGKRLTQRTIGSEDTYSYSYNLRDELISVSNNTGIATFTYDAFGRITAETVNGETTAYAYNNEDETVQLSSLGINQDLAYGLRGLLTQIDIDGVNTYQYSRDNLARLTTLSRNALADTTMSYDAGNQMLQIDHGTGQRDHQYQYDQASRVSQWQGVAGETRDYNYDNNGRITQSQSPTVPQTFSYDALGNRLNQNAQFDAANRLIEDNGFSYSYDVHGNRIEKVNKATGEVERYSYNSLDQLVGYQRFPDDDPGSSATVDYTYTYGPMGRRWSKQDNLTSINTAFYWSSANLVGESSNGVTRRYILDGMVPIGFVEDGETYHYLKDHLGTAHEVVDSSGGIVWQGNYTAFGAVAETTNIVANNLRLPGQYHDQESGLYYNYFRDYDPSLGRYLQSDPLGVQGGINTYVYAANNPLQLTDPTGECPWCVAVVVGGLIGGGIDLAAQLIGNGGNFSCVDWGSVGTSALLGAAGSAIGGGPLLSRAGRAGKEFSHWIPSRYFRPSSPSYKPWIPKWANGPLNGNYTSPARHYRHDPFRYPRGWRDMGDRLNPALQQLDRTPDWLKGAGAGGAAGAAMGGGEDCECN